MNPRTAAIILGAPLFAVSAASAATLIVERAPTLASITLPVHHCEGVDAAVVDPATCPVPPVAEVPARGSDELDLPQPPAEPEPADPAPAPEPVSPLPGEPLPGEPLPVEPLPGAPAPEEPADGLQPGVPGEELDREVDRG